MIILFSSGRAPVSHQSPFGRRREHTGAQQAPRNGRVARTWNTDTRSTLPARADAVPLLVRSASLRLFACCTGVPFVGLSWATGARGPLAVQTHRRSGRLVAQYTLAC